MRARTWGVALVGLLAWAAAPTPGWAEEKEPLGIAMEGYPYPYPVHFFEVKIEGQDLRIVFDTAPPEEAPDLIGSSYADDEIVRLVDELERPVWVVTSDRALRERLAGRVDRVIGGGRFARSL